MGTHEPSSQHTLEETLGVFTRTDAQGTPLTASEVAEELGCARRTAYGKLETLADRGAVETKKVGARGRVWWRPPDRLDAAVNAGHELEHAQFEELVGEVEDYAIFALDADGHVQTWNEGASQLKGYEEGEIVGEHFSRFYAEEDREAGRPERNLATATEQGRVEDEGWRVRKDGSQFWANVTITALRDDNGDIQGYLKVTRDMTERHNYERRLREQRDELDELDRINEVIRDIDQALVTATSREEIEQAVCERLASSDTYAAAWTGTYTADYEDVTPRTWAGVSDDYVAAIRNAGANAAENTEHDVRATALETGTTQTIQRLGSDVDGEPWRERSLDEGYESAVVVPLVYDDTEYGVLTVYADDESAFGERKTAVMSELGETISHAIAAIKREERERALTTLQESTRELLHAGTPAEIGDVIVETLTDHLASTDALVYHFDTDENALESVSSSLQAGSHADQPPLTADSDSPVWASFVEGETRLSDTALSNVDQHRTMVVPLGDHGVLALAAADPEVFEGDTRDFVELVAATAEAAFDRVESQANLRERDELLQEQNQRLQRLNQVNTLIREVDQGIVQATTRDEVQRVVCDRLTTSDRFRFAWIGTPDDLDEGLAPQAWSGDGRGYLDGVDLAAGSGMDEAEPAVTAVRTGDVAVVSNVAADLRDGPWRTEAFSREFQSVISVPLSYDDLTYGVLTVYADRPEVFGDMERSVFAELGETVANAIDAVDTKRALLGDRAVELEFRIGEPSGSVLARLAAEVGCEIAFDGVVPLSEGRARLFFVARDARADAVRDVLEQSVGVESSEVVAGRADGLLVQAVVSGPTLALSLSEQGASLRSLEATADRIHFAVELPSNTDVRRFVERLSADHEQVELLARRERERPVQTRNGLYAELEDALTDRQLEVLKTAYHSGFFASPRQSTGGEVADLLGVSQPTVTEQLRAAQRTVLDLLFEDGSLGA